MPMRTIPQAVAGSESRGGERNASPHASLPRRGRKGHVSTRVGRRRHGFWRRPRLSERSKTHTRLLPTRSFGRASINMGVGVKRAVPGPSRAQKQGQQLQNVEAHAAVLLRSLRGRSEPVRSGSSRTVPPDPLPRTPALAHPARAFGGGALLPTALTDAPHCCVGMPRSLQTTAGGTHGSPQASVASLPRVREGREAADPVLKIAKSP